MRGRFQDLTGQRFGRLVVLERAPNDRTKHTRWWCQCDCGEKVIVYRDALVEEKQKSCGCYNVEIHSGPKYERRFTNDYEFKEDYVVGYAHNTKRKFYLDKEDFDKIKMYCWRESNAGYIVTNDADNEREVLLLHRIVMGVDDNDKNDIDHINHDTYDNRKNNLRIVRHMDNLKNRKIPSNNTSGIIGVSFNKREKKWEAYITVDKKHMKLGQYKSFDDAANARKNAEIKYFGEYIYKREVV